MNRYHTCYAFLIGLVCAVFLGCETSNPTASSTSTSAAGNGGAVAYLNIHRAANLGTGLGVYITIDGASVARMGYGQSYSGTLTPGSHLMSIKAYPNYLFLQPTEKHVTVAAGQTYTFTVSWRGEILVLQ
jgi:hypothetical protein